MTRESPLSHFIDYRHISYFSYFLHNIFIFLRYYIAAGRGFHFVAKTLNQEKYNKLSFVSSPASLKVLLSWRGCFGLWDTSPPKKIQSSSFFFAIYLIFKHFDFVEPVAYSLYIELPRRGLFSLYIISSLRGFFLKTLPNIDFVDSLNTSKVLRPPRWGIFGQHF